MKYPGRIFKAACGCMAVAVSLFVLFWSCQENSGRWQEPSAEYVALVKAYTGGTVTDGIPVRIEFAAPVQGIVPGTEADARLFSFSPALKGSAIWSAPDVLEFIPDGYKPGTSYKATLQLGKIAGLDDAGMKKFDFSFYSASREASITAGTVAITADNPDYAAIYGRIDFSCEVPEEDVAKMLSCNSGGREIGLRITGNTGWNSYGFVASPIARGENGSSVSLVFDGKASGFGRKVTENVSIPAKDRFLVVDALQHHGRDPYIEVRFSEPLMPDLNPDGLFVLEGAGRYYTKIRDNCASIFYENGNREISLTVASGVSAISGQRLGTDYCKVFRKNDIDPAVEIPMKGNILPDADNLLLPFRSVNLSAVDISVVKIFESNVLMFLQSNELDESSELRRSGRIVYKNRIRLDTDPGKDLHKWQDFSIDLSGLFRQEPGAIYRVRLSFRQEYSLYGSNRTADGATSAMVNVSSGQMSRADAAVWDEPYPYYYESTYDWSRYNWKDRDNPLTPSYYMVDSRFPERNILSSNLGIIVKSAGNDRIWVTVNNIIDAQPVSGATVTAYNYQLQKIGEGVSDNSGFAEISTGSGKAFAVTASLGNATSYLKVTDGNEKSLSRFDVGGKVVSSGIKGFVYGERGVWRPGDTLHLSIIIEDKLNRLPDNHPVTVELYNPQGQFYDKKISTRGTKGMYSFALTTKEDDPTGTWNAYFKVGGATFHKALNIEAIKPNRLKMNLELADRVLVAGKPAGAVLAASWLTGPAASGLEATVEMTLGKGRSGFDGYEKYTFNNPVSRFSASSYKVMSGKLGADGTLSAKMNMPVAEHAPGMLSATLLTRIAEPGGDESFTTVTMPFSPFGAYVGVRLPEGDGNRLETDQNHNIDVVTLDKDGRPVAGHRIEYRIYKLKWSWWWESRSESLDSYVNGTSSEAIVKGDFYSSKEKTTIPFRVDYPEWGRYLVYVKDVTSGHASGGIIYVDWPSWRGRSDRTDPDGLTMLAFSLDKSRYTAGEEATVFIPSAKGGKALVSIENASGILSMDWVNTGTEGETPYKFRITDEMAPNCYVHISLLQPHGNTDNDMPLRMYGVQPVFVDNPRTHLFPEITMPDVLRPQEEFVIKVKEKNGKPMSYTVAIVDEGLLDITAFKTPDPWSAMYAREALGVRTWDLYDNVVGAFSGRFSPLFSIGGDENVLKDNKRDNRFNPVVKFLGPFFLSAKGNASHKVALPMYIGSVKAMVVAGADGAYGNASRTVPVRSPLMILPSLPRVLGTGENVILPVNVFAMEDGVRNVDVKVSVKGAAALAGNASETLQFASAGDRMAAFSLVTGDSDGVAEVRIEATGGGYAAEETLYVKVRNPEPAVTSVFNLAVASGKTGIIDYGASDGDTGEANALLELASFPSVDFSSCFNFVADYSHYCTEQLSSKGLTMLYLSDLVGDKDRSTAVEAIPEIIRQICSRQLPDGGFVYWPGASNADEWVSSMAGQFLTEAAAKGYEVNGGVLGAWKNFQKRCVRNYRETGVYDLNDLVQAYRLYTLALASEPDSGAMNRLKSSSGLSAQAAWRLAAAYALTGKKAISREIIGGLGKEVGDYGTGNVTFGSAIRDRAMYLETLVLADELADAMKLASEVAEDFAGGLYYTTQNTAFISIAMSRLAHKVNTDAMDVTVTERSDKRVESAKAVYAMPLDPSVGSVGIRNASEGTVYASVMYERRMPAGTVKAASSGLDIKVEYTDGDGRPLNPANIRQGTDVYVTAEVSNTSAAMDYTNLALTLTVPSGWEIVNDRLTGTETGASRYDYMDIRDDKAICYFDLMKGRTERIRMRFHASYKGEFVVPSIRCEAMYDPSVFARTASGRTVVY